MENTSIQSVEKMALFRSLEFPMYQLVVKMGSTSDMASGPGIDSEYFFTNPVYQEDAIEYLTTVPRKEYSRYGSELMDRLGYSYDMIKYRQQIRAEGDTAVSLHYRNTTRATTGGKGEGTSLYFESDIDYMYVVNDVICADNPQRFIHQENITLFQIERHETSPGYTRLKLLKFEGKSCDKCISQSLFESETGSYYLSSPVFTNAFKMQTSNTVMQSGGEMGATSGPSASALSKYLNFDNVLCFRCYCPDILERWVTRPRSHGWPSPDTIHVISLLDGHVVPVGYKGSQDMYREWRICYSLAELHLMRNFNETQLKVYIILKKISKFVLNPLCDDMTSYIMKNVVLWICEANGVDRFTMDLLTDRLLDCVKYLRLCISENNLPSYMIPERNLLAGRLDIQKRQQLTSLLNDLLHEGGRMLLRIDKLRDAMLVMYKTPDTFREFGEKRDKVERLCLISMRIRDETGGPKMSREEREQRLLHNEQYCDIQTHIDHLIQFDTQALKQMGKTPEEISDLWQSRLQQLLS